jgi:hypothetical protein
MKKLMTFVAAAILGVSTIGCAEKKPTTPPATPPAEGKAEPAPSIEPAPATTEEKK